MDAISTPVSGHVVAMPYPGRGHINPMLNLCKLLLKTNPNLKISFVVTQEWLTFLGSEPTPPPNLHYVALPQVIPSEVGRGLDFPGFMEAVLTKLQDPFERLLDRLEPSPTVIVYDSHLYWAVGVGNRSIPVVAFLTVAASFVTVYIHFDLLVRHGHFPLNVSGLHLIQSVRQTTPMDAPVSGHVVAMPYPGRGHINPMLNLCKLLLQTKPNLKISFVVTQEWLTFLASEPSPPPNLHYVALPQVIPSEVGRALDFPGFMEAVLTKLQDPFERLLDRLEPSPTVIVYDSYLYWAVGVGNRRSIPVATFFSIAASCVTVLVHFDLLVRHGHFPLNVAERGHEVVDYIPGLAPTTIADLPTIFHGNGNKVYHRVLESMAALENAQCVLFSSIYEFEGPVLDCLKLKLGIPVYSIGPMIPYFNLKSKNAITNGASAYFQWLDSQANHSVLYISQGSFLSVTSAQGTEFVEGIKLSGVPFLWVTRGDTSMFDDGIAETGFLVPWCDQLKVLCHPSVGGFWTHCGWNSTSEGIYTGVPMLTCPIFWDQIPNSKLIVNDLKIGSRVMKSNGDVPEKLLTRQQVALLVRKFMDSESDERKEMVARAQNTSDIFKRAVAEGGSAASDLVSFVNSI